MSDISSSSNVNAGLVIDPVTRKISAKNGNEKLFVAKNDHNSTVLSFEIPKYIDGHDMSSKDTFIHIHFVNMDAEDSTKTSGGVCDATATAVEATEGTLTFSWCIPRIATRYEGVLSLGVTFECYENSDGEAEEVYSWSSAPYGDVVVCNSIDNDREETQREYSYLVETCNAIVSSALKTDLSYLVGEALKTAKDSGEFDGEKGDKGDGWVVRGYYTTLDKLKVSVDFPVQGDTYAVGKREPYTYYTYDTEKGWVSQGTFSPILAESYARGGTGIRSGEDSDNAKFYFEKTKERLKGVSNAHRNVACDLNSVKIRDVSPSEHDMKVTVTSPCIVPIVPYDFGDAEELGGVHADVNDDGTVVINGICNSEEAKGKYVLMKEIFLESGIYTINLTKSISDEYLELAVSTDIDFITTVCTLESISGEEKALAFFLNEPQTVYIGIKTQFSKGENYALSFKPKLYIGKVKKYDLSSLKSIDVIDSKGNTISYPCSGKASDTSVSLWIKSIPGEFRVQSDDIYGFDIYVEYYTDTNAFNNKFCPAVDGHVGKAPVLFFEDVSTNSHLVTVSILTAYNNEEDRYFKVYGTNLLNIYECVLNDCEGINNIRSAGGLAVKGAEETCGPEIVVRGDLKDILSQMSGSQVFTFSTRSTFDPKEYMAVRIVYDDDSVEEFIGEKGSSALTFTYTPPTDKSIANIYLYPRKTDEPSNVTKSVSGIQFEIGQKTSFCPYTVKEYDLLEGRAGDITKNDYIRDVPSIAPKMTIKCNTACSIEADYKKDINKVIENLQNAILSLGGNI